MIPRPATSSRTKRLLARFLGRRLVGVDVSKDGIVTTEAYLWLGRIYVFNIKHKVHA